MEEVVAEQIKKSDRLDQAWYKSVKKSTWAALVMEKGHRVQDDWTAELFTE
jgi:hypothetical protein